MKFKNILLLYKRSAYNIYFMNKNSTFNKKSKIVQEERKRFKSAHDAHYKSLRNISRTLFTNGVRFTECYRGRNIDYSPYDLVITVGGDGTFLEAAKRIKNQVMIGVNSAPKHSIGRFCIANENTFEKVLKRIMTNKFRIDRFQRLRLKFLQSKDSLEALNDILLCHRNPAVLCRYYLEINNWKEEQRSSGVWIATPAGSSGAIRSAGGKLLNAYDKKFQYLPRELYPQKKGFYKLNGSVLMKDKSITVTSLMRKGMAYLDGAHQKVPFEYGSTIKITVSPHPIKTIRL